MMSPRRLLDKITLACLKLQLLDRIIGYLAWQRRRGVRRRLESDLAQTGQYPDEVIRGTFSGMRLPPRTLLLNARFEKVFGAYEHEVFKWLEQLAAVPRAFSLIVSPHALVELTMRGPDYGDINPLQGLRMFEVDALVG
jgi:hypothetical protein